MKFQSNIRVIGVSSGLGVPLYPFRKHVIANIEPRSIFHTPGNEQWKANFGRIPLFKDSSWLNDMFIRDCDVIISSPDCGSGSMLRYSRAKKLGDHKLNASLHSFFQSVEFYNPKFFLFENLPALFKSFPKENFKKEVDNYRLIEINCSMSCFGNSQKSRVRLVIIGIRKDLDPEIDSYFKKPRKFNKIKTCDELYGDLPLEKDIELGHIRENPKESISIHGGCKMTVGEIKKEFQTTRVNDRRWKVEGKKYANAPGVYRNLPEDYPKTARKANRQFDHNGDMLTPRQLARIMGVSDNFRIYMKDLNYSNYWINKARTAITKGMVYEVARYFKKCLTKSQHLWIASN